MAMRPDAAMSPDAVHDAARAPVWGPLAAGLVLGAGLIWRLYLAATTYLNPDEVLHLSKAVGIPLAEVYASAIQVHHPPLLIVLLNLVSRISLAEWWLRLGPVLAGAIGPWFAARWVARLAGWRAGFIALVILTLSPNLVELGAQLRGYSLMLLCAAVALDALEAALDTGSARRMLVFSAALLLAILSEYSALWLAVSAGLYALVRFYRDARPRALMGQWAAGQIAVVAACLVLLYTTVRILVAEPGFEDLRQGYLKGGFPEPGQHLVVFAGLGFVKQCAYLCASVPMGFVAGALFLASLLLFRRRDHAALLVLPFGLFLGGALLRLYPFGRTRHSVLLAIFLAAGIGCAIDAALRRWPRLAAGGLLLAFSLAVVTHTPDQQNIPASRHRRASLLSAIAHLRRVVPEHGWVYTTGGGARIIDFYVRGAQALQASRDARWIDSGPFRLAWDGPLPADHAARQERVAQVRRRCGLTEQDPVWVVDGGFTLTLTDAESASRFQNALVIVRDGAAAIR